MVRTFTVLAPPHIKPLSAYSDKKLRLRAL